MALTTDHLAALQAAIAEHSREILTNHRYVLPGQEAPAIEWPEAVRSAREFHTEVLQHGELGDAHVRRLPADMGSGWLLIAHHSESRWGVAEAYSPQGDLQAAGVYLSHGVVAWHDLSSVRQAAQEYQSPAHLIPKGTPLEWITYGYGDDEFHESVGGRFSISLNDPARGLTGFTLRDSVTNTEHPCDTADAARAQAQAILSAS
jgi:hypothetical protein